jgi:hypothetical protein
LASLIFRAQFQAANTSGFLQQLAFVFLALRGAK